MRSVLGEPVKIQQCAELILSEELCQVGGVLFAK